MALNTSQTIKDELNGIIISEKPVSVSTLKRLLLVFDKIYFLEPEQNRFLIPKGVATIQINKGLSISEADYGVLYNGQNYANEEDELLDKFDYAINRGIIKIIDYKLKEFYIKNWYPLRIAYEFDSGNAELMNSLSPLVLRKSDYSREDGLLRGTGMRIAGIQLYPEAPAQALLFNEIEDKEFNLNHQNLSNIGKINRSLTISNDFELIPIFLNEYTVKAFSIKTEIARMKRNGMLEGNLSKLNLERNIQHLMQKISEVLLPDEIIKNVSVKELIIARENSYHECIKLRRKLIRSLHFLSENEFGTEFTKEVEKYISFEVEPLIKNYQIKFIQSLEHFLKYSITAATTIGGTMIGYQQSLSPNEIVFYGGVSAAVGNIASDLTSYLIKKPSQRMNNTFTYFTNFRE